MYDFGNFGQRLQNLRKGKGMTQEDLAQRIGVSGQAVSKWETNQSYPDITLIPNLAQILGTNVSFLFGEKPDVPASNADFPPEYQGLLLVNKSNLVACYSNKTVASKDESGVKFTDGSTAELSTRIAVNKGQGSILFLSNDEPEKIHDWQKIDTTVTSKEFEFEHCHSINVSVLNCSCNIVPSASDKTRVSAKGGPKFLHMLDVKYDSTEMFLYVGFKSDDNNNQTNNNERGNQLLIELPVHNFENGILGGHMKLQTNGSGNIISEVPLFNTGQLTINGSGSIETNDFATSCKAVINGSGNISGNSTDELVVQTNGSGNIQWNLAKKASVSINGSGDVCLNAAERLNVSIAGSGNINAGEITDGSGDLTVKIVGSGDIEIEGGVCQKFDADIRGSGNINAANLTANKALIVIHENGDVVLGRVIESSTEQIKKKGSIKILNRGNA
jgi:DNA-binding XRE family transcriptional regulator